MPEMPFRLTYCRLIVFRHDLVTCSSILAGESLVRLALQTWLMSQPFAPDPFDVLLTRLPGNSFDPLALRRLRGMSFTSWPISSSRLGKKRRDSCRRLSASFWRRGMRSCGVVGTFGLPSVSPSKLSVLSKRFQLIPRVASGGSTHLHQVRVRR